MAKYNSLGSLFSDIADSIREAGGASGTIAAEDFPVAIANCGGGVAGEKVTTTVKTGYNVKKGCPVRFDAPLTAKKTGTITSAYYNTTPMACETVEIDKNTVLLIYCNTSRYLSCRVVTISDDGGTVTVGNQTQISSTQYTGYRTAISPIYLGNGYVWIAYCGSSSYYLYHEVIKVNSANRTVSVTQKEAKLYTTGSSIQYNIDSCIMSDGHICCMHPYTQYYGLSFTILTVGSNYTVTKNFDYNYQTGSGYLLYNGYVVPSGFYNNATNTPMVTISHSQSNHRLYWYQIYFNISGKTGAVLGSTNYANNYSAYNHSFKYKNDNSYFVAHNYNTSNYYPWYGKVDAYGNDDGRQLYYNTSGGYYIYSSNSYGLGAANYEYKGSDCLVFDDDVYFFGPLNSTSNYYLYGYRFTPLVGTNGTGIGSSTTPVSLYNQSQYCAYYCRATLVGNNIFITGTTGGTIYYTVIRGYVRPSNGSNSSFGYAKNTAASGASVEIIRTWRNPNQINMELLPCNQ